MGLYDGLGDGETHAAVGNGLIHAPSGRAYHRPCGIIA